MRLVGKKILITGGAGFIGSYLVDALASKNRVTVVDNLSTASKENIRYHLERGKILFIQSDITDARQMNQIMNGHQIVFHLASLHPAPSLQEVSSLAEVNVTGTCNLCQAAVEAKVERFIYVSSSEIYGNAMLPLKEDIPANPTNPFGMITLASETCAKYYHLAFNLPVIVIRPFYTYGPRTRLDGLIEDAIPRFVIRTMNNLPPVIYGDGQQTRDFTEVRDVVRGLILAGESESSLNQVINIATGREITLNYIAQLVLNVLGRDQRLKPLHIDARPKDVLRSFADITKARTLLGYEPQIKVEEGIWNYINWIQKQQWDTKQLQQQGIGVTWRP